jgi:hypothetical protein
MSGQWQHQVRVYLDDAHADAARQDPASQLLAPLTAILDRHGATIVSQLEAFESYVAEAERAGSESDPLYRWTKATLADPEKRRKHALAFAVRLSGSEVYPADEADALEADLRPLVGHAIQRIARHDTNPANNLPIPPEHRS